MALTGRLALHDIFREVLGSNNVYFRPPDGTVMRYPCIKYEKDNINTRYADNTSYHMTDRYTGTVIDEDPDSEIIYDILKLPYTSFGRHYIADGLCHDTFTIFFGKESEE